MVQSSGRNQKRKTNWTYYAAWCAVVVSVVGLVYGSLSAFLPMDSDARSMLGLSGTYSAQAWLLMGIVMDLQSLFGLLAGIFGIRAAHSNYPPDGKPFFIFAVIGLLLSIGGLFAAGFTSFVAIIVDGVCAYQGWEIMHRPMKKSKAKKRR
ncbi:MAG: hypothetical protein ACOX1O_02575 [Eggerthellaceae bacterium]|jgi:hypothetical protein